MSERSKTALRIQALVFIIAIVSTGLLLYKTLNTSGVESVVAGPICTNGQKPAANDQEYSSDQGVNADFLIHYASKGCNLPTSGIDPTQLNKNLVLVRERLAHLGIKPTPNPVDVNLTMNLATPQIKNQTSSRPTIFVEPTASEGQIAVLLADMALARTYVGLGSNDRARIARAYSGMAYGGTIEFETWLASTKFETDGMNRALSRCKTTCNWNRALNQEMRTAKIDPATARARFQ